MDITSVDSNIIVENEEKKSISVQDKDIIVANSEPEFEVTVQRKEYSIVGDELYIPKRYEDAPQWIRDLIGTVTEESFNQKITELNSLTQTLNQLIVELDVAKNTYTQSIISSNDIDERINTAITILNNSLANSDATIVELLNTKVTSNDASSIALDVISASINSGAINALTSNIETASVDRDSALANDISLVHSELSGDIEGNADAITSLNTSVTNINNTLTAQSVDITNLTTEVNNGTNTWAESDSTLENSLTTYITNEGARVESKFAYNSNVNINGVWKKSGFGLTTKYTSGNGTESNPYVSEFWIDASRLKFTNSNQTGRTAPFTIDATGVTPQITFNGKVSFTNVSDTQGSGTNLLYNSAPKIGNETKGWSIGWSNHGLSSSIGSGFDPWRPTGGASVYVVVPGSPGIGTVFDISNSRFPVIANTRYEASVYLSSHRCDSRVTLAWFDINGNYISESSGTSNSSASSGPLAGWGRSTMFATAPSNAATAQFYVRSVVTSNDPYCFVAYAYAGISSTNQTIPSNWSEGSSAGVSSSDVVNDINAGNTTTIDGEKITTASIKAAQINVDNALINELNVVGGIVADTINGNVLNGTVINGARINGSVIKASYLDLDGELEVITNYHITVAMYNANPSLYTDAVYLSGTNEYRIPSLSTIREETKTQNISINGAIFNSKIRSYNCANAGHNLKCVKDSTAFIVSTDVLLFTLNTATQMYNGDYRENRSSMVDILFANNVLSSIFFTCYDDESYIDNTSNGTSRINVYSNGAQIYSYTDHWSSGYITDNPLVPPNVYNRFTVNGINFRLKVTQFNGIEVYIENGTYNFPFVFNSPSASLLSLKTITYPNPQTGAVSSVYGYFNSSIYINNMI